jgi:hypothetical protein
MAHIRRCEAKPHLKPRARVSRSFKQPSAQSSASKSKADTLMNVFRCLTCVMLAAVCGVAQAIDRDEAQIELAQATTAVQAAERDDAARHAPADLGEAHAMLDEAIHAADAHAWADAARYSERAKVCGDLASARSRQHRAEAATAEIERSVNALQAAVTSGGGS